MRRPIERARTALKCRDHALHCLVKEHADQILQHHRFEFELEIEADPAVAVAGIVRRSSGSSDSETGRR